jgi:hypothetical protein
MGHNKRDAIINRLCSPFLFRRMPKTDNRPHPLTIYVPPAEQQ